MGDQLCSSGVSLLVGVLSPAETRSTSREEATSRSLGTSPGGKLGHQQHCRLVPEMRGVGEGVWANIQNKDWSDQRCHP
uniref:Putative secreted protein n=1 Tax=Ixodes ricinus TaxID=34613 RepID=A0A6B0TXM9_IXORI